MKKRPQVALLIETSNAYARELLHGVRAYVRENRPWSMYLAEHGRGDAPPAWLRGWHGDGIIARIETPNIARAVVATGLPTVDVSAARLVPELPWLETDDLAIARVAAEHLRERGFQSFGYCGDPRFNWSNWRREAFVKYLAAAGFQCSVYQSPRVSQGSASWEQDQRGMARWIRALPKPAGVFACYDIRGLQVLEACRRMGVAIPDEVAVIGVDNDELLCDLSDPPLSSVIPNVRRTGYESAALLDRMMSGHLAPPEGRLFEPLGVATRQSTDVLAIRDRHISQAVRFIREHACDGICVADVLKAVPLSRRVLEQRFRKLLGRTPHEQILQVKLDRVKLLLTQTDMALAIIAERSGFAHVEYLSVAFKKNVGVTPSEFRTKGRE
jgi:LacI family transcriptional regulator